LYFCRFQIAWLFNIRGFDIDYNPVITSYAVVTLDKAHLFVDRKKIADVTVENHFADHVAIHAYESIEGFLDLLSAEGGRVLADPAQLNWRLYKALGSAVQDKLSVLTLPKAVKNATELQGVRESHIRDGAALTAFIHWLGIAAAERPGTFTEHDACLKLEEFRERVPLHVSPSFPTIAGYAANGAIIHYKPEPATTATVFNGPEAMFLLDSGAQYLDGTTDVTR
jgi:Xaa-Pro aminopeptidase